MSRKEVLILQMHKIVKDGANPENLKEFVVERKKGAFVSARIYTMNQN